jgi:activator of HSP90 ATPase
MKTDSIKVSALIAAEPEAVYKAWISSKSHTAMTGSAATVTPRAGCKFSAWDGYIFGKTLKLKPSSRIQQSWRTTEFADTDEDSMLVVTLEKAKGGTKITLDHSHIPAGHGPEYRKGWIDFYFKPMKEYFSKGG